MAKLTGSTRYYFHKDHLGSSTAMTDATGAKIETTEYVPYGEMRDHQGTEVTNYKFTDQELDPETGLYNYGARLYDPVIGRFISPDTIIPNVYDPQSLNRYSYCRNNPLIYTDPTGHGWGNDKGTGPGDSPCEGLGGDTTGSFRDSSDNSVGGIDSDYFGRSRSNYTDYGRRNSNYGYAHPKSIDRDENGYIPWSAPTYPVDPKYPMTSEFGPRKDPITGKENTPHYGIDVACPIGTPVRSPEDGVVTKVDNEENPNPKEKPGGKQVVVEHDEKKETGYAHLSKVNVKKGDKVNKGQTIAETGNTGRSTGPHAHVSYKEYGESKNPRGPFPGYEKKR